MNVLLPPARATDLGALLALLPEVLKKRTKSYFRELLAKAADDIKAGRVVDGPDGVKHLRESLKAKGE